MCHDTVCHTYLQRTFYVLNEKMETLHGPALKELQLNVKETISTNAEYRFL